MTEWVVSANLARPAPPPTPAASRPPRPSRARRKSIQRLGFAGAEAAFGGGRVAHAFAIDAFAAAEGEEQLGFAGIGEAGLQEDAARGRVVDEVAGFELAERGRGGREGAQRRGGEALAPIGAAEPVADLECGLLA